MGIMDMTGLNLRYGELADDGNFASKCDNLVDQLVKMQDLLDQLLPLKKLYDKMALPDQIELDLLLAFLLNSLHWIKLRIQGGDLSTHPIKNELKRIKAAMQKWQQVKDRDSRPTVNVDAAKRFIRGGLYDHKENGNPPNKKRKFEDYDPYIRRL